MARLRAFAICPTCSELYPSFRGCPTCQGATVPEQKPTVAAVPEPPPVVAEPPPAPQRHLGPVIGVLSLGVVVAFGLLLHALS